MTTEKMITITQKEFDQLCHDSNFLNCLQGCGVDNWDGYDYAIEAFEEMNEEEN